MYNDRRDFSVLVGQTLISIEGLGTSSDEVIFTTETTSYVMYHSQDCCESVLIEDIEGNVSDLIGYGPVTLAEESTGETPSGVAEPSESYTWTFYRLATAKGMVVIRWLGESNGYYSESVDFEEQVV